MKTNVNLINKSISGDQQENSAVGLTAAWNIPAFGMSESKCRAKRANRYLRHQRCRFDKYIMARDWDKAARMFTAMMSSSRSLQVYYFNRVVKGWYYKYSESYINQLFEQFRRTIRNWDSNLVLKRSYIEKSNGRWRPIGAPSLTWRIIAAAMTDLLYNILYSRIGEHCYGFMPKRSLKKAWMEIRKRASRGAIFYEYDLDSFFNRVSRSKIYEILEEYGLPSYLNRYLWYVNEALPHFKELKEEEEIKETPYFFLKNGLPQGLHWSPLLSVMIKDYAFRKLDIESICYADDGLMEVKGDFETWRKELCEKEIILRKEYGIELSKKLKKNGEKACKLAGEEIDFLGVKWNRKADAVETDAGWIKFENLTEKQLVEGVEYKGERKAKLAEEWKINRKSYIERIDSLESQVELGLKFGEGLIAQFDIQKKVVNEELSSRTVYWAVKEEKRIKIRNTWVWTKYPTRYYDVIKSSSICCNMLLEAIWHRRYRFNSLPTKFGNKAFWENELVGAIGIYQTDALLSEITGMDLEDQMKEIANARSRNGYVNQSQYRSKPWVKDNQEWLKRVQKLGKWTINL